MLGNSNDIIQNACHTPTYQEIVDYINNPAKVLWDDINSFIQQKYKVSPKIMYSKCAEKPGWNVKYQKSGKSLCTLYPEREIFVALVVITLDLAAQIEAMTDEFEPVIFNTIKTVKPFNGTLWLMIPVSDQAVLNNIKQILLFKHMAR